LCLCLCLCLCLLEGIEGEAAEKSGAHVMGNSKGKKEEGAPQRLGRNPPTRGFDLVECTHSSTASMILHTAHCTPQTLDTAHHRRRRQRQRGEAGAGAGVRRGGRSGSRREDPPVMVRSASAVCLPLGWCMRRQQTVWTLIHLHRLTCSQHVSRPSLPMCRLIKYLITIPSSFRPSHRVSSPLLISSPISHLPSPVSHLPPRCAARPCPAPFHLCTHYCYCYCYYHSCYYCLSLSLLHITTTRVSPHYARPLSSSARQLLGCAPRLRTRTPLDPHPKHVRLRCAYPACITRRPPSTFSASSSPSRPSFPSLTRCSTQIARLLFFFPVVQFSAGLAPPAETWIARGQQKWSPRPPRPLAHSQPAPPAAVPPPFNTPTATTTRFTHTTSSLLASHLPTPPPQTPPSCTVSTKRPSPKRTPSAQTQTLRPTRARSSSAASSASAMSFFLHSRSRAAATGGTPMSSCKAPKSAFTASSSRAS
jgi:hypothetical protein